MVTKTLTSSALPVPMFLNAYVAVTLLLSALWVRSLSSMRIVGLGRLITTHMAVKPVKTAVSIPPVAAQSRVANHSPIPILRL